MDISITADNCSSHSAANDDHGTNLQSYQSSDALAANDRARPITGPVPSRSPSIDKALPQTFSTTKSEKESQSVGSNSAKLSKEAQGLCAILDEILSRMMEVHQRMTDFQTYIHLQKQHKKPLYQWIKYDDYHILGHALSTLDETTSKLKPITEEHVRLPFKHFAIYLGRAAQFSTSVSNAAVYALGAISQRSATCMFEIDQSSLCDEAKDNVKTLIFSEVRELIKHSTRATDRMYATMDLLQKTIFIDHFIEQDNRVAKKRSTNSEATPQASGALNWAYIIVCVILGAAMSAAIGLAAAHLCSPGQLNLRLKWDKDGNRACGQVIDIVEQSQAVANITGASYWSKLRDIDQRYQDLKTVSEAHGLRIDNLVDALGPPNIEGNYFPSVSLPNHHLADNTKSLVQQVSDDTDRQTKRLHDEMEQMRKNLLRMDIRLTRRIDKVSRGV